MKTILINEAIYILNNEIRSVSKQNHHIVFEYTNNQKTWIHFENNETRNTTFDEILTIMNEIE